jgi:hypothetical protein
MIIPEYIRFIFAVFAIAAGIALSIRSLSSKYRAAKWAKKMLFFCGLCAVVWGILLMLRLTYLSLVPSESFYLIDHYKAVIGGTCIGIFFTLFLSGELNLNEWKRKNKT